MKAFVLCLSTFAIINSFITAQITLGIQGGVSVSDISMKASEVFANTSQLAGISIGVVPKYKVDEKWSVRSGVSYSSKGFKIHDIASGPSTASWRINYLDWMPQYEFSPAKYIGIRLGGFIGLKMSEKIRPADSKDWNDPMAEFAKNLDFGLSGGISGYLKSLEWFVDYQFGLNDISTIVFTDGNGNAIPDPGNVYSRSLRVGLSYFLL